jgi:hypothetical protein
MRVWGVSGACCRLTDSKQPIVRVQQVGFNFNFNLYKMHGEYNIKYFITNFILLKIHSVRNAKAQQNILIVFIYCILSQQV